VNVCFRRALSAGIVLHKAMSTLHIGSAHLLCRGCGGRGEVIVQYSMLYWKIPW